MEKSRKVNELMGWDSAAIDSMMMKYLKEKEKGMLTKIAKKLYLSLFNKGALLQVNGVLYEPISSSQRLSPQSGCSMCALKPNCAQLEIAELCINIDLVGFEETDKPSEAVTTIFKEYDGVLPPKKTVLTIDVR